MNKYILIIFSVLFLSACGNKNTQNKITPTPAPKVFEMPQSERPYVSLIPRDDGHMIFLKLKNIPSYVKQIEYELLYSATDGDNEIEKGVGDTIKDIKSSLERSLLLGTESCTSGCKYKYDEGVFGGTLTLNFITNDGQISTFETPFTIKNSSEIKKAGKLTLPTQDISISTQPSDKNFYILMKNYQFTGFSVFSSSNSTAKYSEISPSIFSKEDKLLTGDYKGQ